MSIKSDSAFPITPGEKQRRKIVLRFPTPIQQISETEIEVEVSETTASVISEAAQQIADENLGKRDGCLLVDEMTDKFNREMIIRGII